MDTSTNGFSYGMGQRSVDTPFGAGGAAPGGGMIGRRRGARPIPNPSERSVPAKSTTGVERPVSAIYIGNSFFYYNNGMNGHVTQVVAAADPAHKWRSTLVAISGAGLDWHDVASYFRPGAIGAFSFDADNNVVFNKLDRLFDVALMMDGSQSPIHPQLAPAFDAFCARHCATVREHGAAPALVMSWAYADKPDMIDGLAAAYARAGEANGCLVIPTGLAFARALAERPGLVLHAPDKRHPSLAGTYLGAATIYAGLFGRSPEPLAYDAELDPETARFLRRVAWDTHAAYHRI